MNKFKLTGVNIAAALLILAFFFPWISVMTMSFSGFSIAINGISPGILGHFVDGIYRLAMILTLVVPLSGALILYQNVTGNMKFSKQYKLAHIVPAVFIIVCIVMLYFKMKPDNIALSGDYGERYGEMLNGLSRSARDMAPGAFDILGVGIYMSLIAGIYLLLVNMGKVADKEYYKPAVNDGATVTTPTSSEQL